MSKLDEIIERTFMAGYECGKKETGLQMVIASDVIQPAAKQQIKALMLEPLDELERKVYANKDSTIEGRNGFSTESAAMMVWIRELHEKVNAL